MTFDPALVVEHFPAELRVLPQWVAWRREERKPGDWTKVPYASSGVHASSTNAATWCSFGEALAAQVRGRYDGVGFVFAGGVYTGVDLDHCRDPETDAIDAWALKVLGDLQGYSEASPSGTGVHVIVRATLPGKGRNRRVTAEGAQPDAKIEIYDRGRYFTATGARLTEHPAGIESRQDAVSALYASLDAPAPDAEAVAPPPQASSPTPHDLSDDDLLDKAMSAKNGDAFRRLWNGDTSGHGDDDSAADLALCSHLAFWFGPDAERIDRLFRRSRLFREKWERQDYRDRTIAKALEGRTDFYEHRTAKSRADEPVAAGVAADVATEVIADGYVLVPGQHTDDQGVVHEVGADDFVRNVIERLPVGALYRMDFVVGELVGEPGARRFATVVEQRLRAVVDSHVNFAKWVPRKGCAPERVFVACSRDQAGLLLAAAGADVRVPELRLLVHYPVYLPDFELAKPGWNAASGIFYDEPSELRGLTPRREGAVELLRDIVVDFPFMDEASRQNLFGAMVTPVVRPAIRGKVPFHLLLAPLERTGKGKLVDTAVGEAVIGHAIAPMQPGRTEEEREKRITSLLLQGETAVHLDNLPVGEVVDSPSLASLATSWPWWRGRILGVSRTPLLPNNLVTFLSGNNVKTTGEIAKRTTPIVLQPLDDHPEDRTGFVHADAEGYARSRRREVLEAIIGMVEAWKAAGRPPAAHRRTMGGFEKWAEIVGGVLAHAGLVEWMANYRDWVRGADEWTSDAETLVEHWAKTHRTEPIRAAQVLEMIRELEIFPAVTGKPTPEARWSALGKNVLAPLTGRPVGCWQVVADGKGASKRYRLREHLPSGVDPGTGEVVEPAPATGPEGSEGSKGSSSPHYTRAQAHARVPYGSPKHPSDPSDPSDAARSTDTAVQDLFDFDERSAVREFDGGQSRDDAERAARDEEDRVRA